MLNIYNNRNKPLNARNILANKLSISCECKKTPIFNPNFKFLAAMKKIGWLLVGALMLSISCRKTTEEVIDCALELMFSGVSYTADVNDPKLIAFELEYAGTFAVTIAWEYGDGTSETRTGLVTTHRYDSAGRYEAKANITLAADKHVSCSVSKKKTVDVH